MLIADGTFLRYKHGMGTWIYANGYEIYVTGEDGGSRWQKEWSTTEYSDLGTSIFYVGHLAQGLL